jgi:hypothetical protein
VHHTTEQKKYPPKFKSSHPDSQNEVGKLARKGFLPRFICPLMPFLDLSFTQKCSNTVATALPEYHSTQRPSISIASLLEEVTTAW